MTNVDLPTNVFTLIQGSYDVIPGSPWVYSIEESILNIFKTLRPLEKTADIVLGMKTSDNFRFVRYWWEINDKNKNWVAYEKHVTGFPYYYPTHALVLWNTDSIAYFHDYYSAQLPNEKYWMRPGINFSSISSTRFTTKLLVGGRMCDMAANTIFPSADEKNAILGLLGILNSNLCQHFMRLLNPTINFQVIDVKRLPYPNTLSKRLQDLVIRIIRLQIRKVLFKEQTYDYKLPIPLGNKLDEILRINKNIKNTQIQIDDEVYILYGIGNDERASIDTQIIGGNVDNQEDVVTDKESDIESNEDETTSDSEKAIEWASFAVGIILGRFHPGSAGSLGSAIYRRPDFAIGSLPEPTEEEFNELVGDPSQFAYIDEQGGRHVFSRQVEQALQKLALMDGIAVFDPNHPRDLPTLVSKALELILGQAQAQEVIQQAAGGDLRKFLEKDFFTQHHIKQYRKRPVYWPIQSSKRSYGFVLFHEKIDRNTFYALQQEPYLPTKRRAVQLRLEELSKKVLTAQGAARKPIEKEMDELRQLAEELAQFAKDLDAITRSGYEPEADWIDDGVILRMAPLWSVIPLWKSEPKKYWEDLAAGKYDWSRIAMKYWPERVRKACVKNKSYAIAHGHDEWYKGG